MLIKGTSKVKQSNSASTKDAKVPERRKNPKNIGTDKKDNSVPAAKEPEPANEESDLDLENELDEETALNELAGEQDLSTDDEEVFKPPFHAD